MCAESRKQRLHIATLQSRLAAQESDIRRCVSFTRGGGSEVLLRANERAEEAEAKLKVMMRICCTAARG